MEAWYHNVPIRPAEREQFKKVKVVQGTVEYGKPIVVRGERIALYHPEHGLLELPEGEYIAFRVPYRVAGHE
ncbi:MAG: hypothetical protein DRN91_08470 [Candidatus Alkanophagales archaeon]|nr:MAG: hypothetical protein DRN91_08470 [Candidatus Alkanophagales archaeon]